MIYSLRFVCVLLLSGALFPWADSAAAATLVMKDSDAFTYLYEMDVNPSTQDLDNFGGGDWWASGIPTNYSGGFASSNQNTDAVLFRTDFGNSITRAALGANTPYTIEVRVEKTGGAQGSNGWFALALQSPGATDSARFSFQDDRVTFRTAPAVGGNFTEFLTETDFTSGFHTVRIAYTGANEYYVWVNDLLLNVDLDTPLLGGNGNFNSVGGWLIGDFSGDTAGDWRVDYIRFDNTGAYMPTPEPATWALLGIGAAGIVGAHRRRCRTT